VHPSLKRRELIHRPLTCITVADRPEHIELRFRVAQDRARRRASAAGSRRSAFRRYLDSSVGVMPS
jgi:hypothetical protein